MTYKELRAKAKQYFDPQCKGIIKGYSVEVLFCISRMADTNGWDVPVVADTLRDRLTGNEALDQCNVTAVLDLLKE